ncbi:MAG: ATP-binding cassette domain-containing protein [Lachnospiraceae bacterium]|nr:ATP-binding cassette domain-containing protein [Lachnospiraceae bacterium]
MQLSAENISFRYTEKSPWILKDINLQIETGERVGIVGPSGYGKSTLAKILAGYNRANSGQVLLDGKPLQTKGFCPVQMIYQHPELAVNPRWKMEKILKECWNPDEKILERFGIEKDWLTRWPRELSGGELQRFCIVRLLSPETKFLICDEITTMLDVISQAQIWNVLLEMAKERNYGMLIVTHNMDLAKRVCTRIVDLSEINRR